MKRMCSATEPHGETTPAEVDLIQAEDGNESLETTHCSTINEVETT